MKGIKRFNKLYDHVGWDKRDHADFFPNGKRKKMAKKEKPAPKENPPSKSASNEGYARFSLFCNELDGNGTPQTRRRYTE